MRSKYVRKGFCDWFQILTDFMINSIQVSKHKNRLFRVSVISAYGRNDGYEREYAKGRIIKQSTINHVLFK